MEARPKFPSPIPPPPELVAAIDDVIPTTPFIAQPAPPPRPTPPPPTPSPPIISAPPDLPSIIVAPESKPEPAPAPQPPPTPPVESAGRLEPHEIPVLASPFASSRARLRWPLDRRVAIGVGVGTCVLLLVLVVVVSLARHPDATARTTPSPTSSAASFTAPAPTPTTPTTPPEPTVTASATASAAPPKPRGPFNRKQANAAIAAAVKDLSDCSRKHGVWGTGQAGVSFQNDGTVRRVFMSKPFDGPEGKCVVKHIEDGAQIDPFNGVIGPVYATFVVPYTKP